MQLVDFDKRKRPRAKVKWPATIKTSAGMGKAEVDNISPTGALIHCRELLALDEKVHLSIKVAEFYTMEITAETVRLEVYESEDGSPSYGLGVRFLVMSNYDFRYLSNYVSKEPFQMSQVQGR